MESTRNLMRAITPVLVLAAPALALRLFSDYFDAPHLQPLGLTKENVASVERAHDGTGFATVDVHVDWGRDWDGALTQARLRQRLVATLEAQTSYYHIMFSDVPGRDISVRFEVGPNRYGPFPPSQIPAGITSAIMALRMTNGPEK
ncbi:hypothetical protein EI983_02845 [Roseovarius faecimaris]|uniref:Uncharacterized protein n=1 Tax=Roseovarius faecimaris TaxID=2494550 RepID=A0A6I6IXA6_9RHOB|nr:hypothetical protein [Roseovarius faecimaris]QGX97268.1 hypothetical protein EI983_02845 [Roseovarius faecimaris]